MKIWTSLEKACWVVGFIHFSFFAERARDSYLINRLVYGLGDEAIILFDCHYLIVVSAGSVILRLVSIHVPFASVEKKLTTRFPSFVLCSTAERLPSPVERRGSAAKAFSSFTFEAIGQKAFPSVLISASIRTVP